MFGWRLNQRARCREALERICPLDLHPDAFGVDHAARTVMEHLGVLIIRTGEEAYLLLSASSSAGSFQHALHLSMEKCELTHRGRAACQLREFHHVS